MQSVVTEQLISIACSPAHRELKSTLGVAHHAQRYSSLCNYKISLRTLAKCKSHIDSPLHIYSVILLNLTSTNDWPAVCYFSNKCTKQL